MTMADRGPTGMTKAALIFAAVSEAATGVAFLIDPSLVAQLLFGQALAPVAVVIARVGGLALIGLGVACWPGPPRLGMLIYSALVALYLAYVGIAGGLTGVLLWPAIAVHAVLAVMLARAFVSGMGRSPEGS